MMVMVLLLGELLEGNKIKLLAFNRGMIFYDLVPFFNSFFFLGDLIQCLLMGSCFFIF